MIRSDRRAIRRAHVPNPTVTFADLFRALARRGRLAQVESRVADSLGVPNAVMFASARGALSAAIRAVGAPAHVVVPAYTCVAVPNAVFEAGAAPTWVDVDGRGLLDPEATDLDQSDVVIVQDTYGFPAPMPSHGRVVRDASHRVDLVAEGGPLISVTSFEHSKWLSAGRGGLAVTRDRDLAEALRRQRDSQGSSGRRRDPLVTGVTLLAGRLDYAGRRGLARRLTRLAASLDADRIAGQSAGELRGRGIPSPLLGRPARVSANLMEIQTKRTQRVADHRRNVVASYDRAAGVSRAPEPLVRYPLTVDEPDAFEAALRAAGWDVRGRWFDAPVHPAASDAAALGYVAGSAPRGERLARTTVNLPTHPLVTEADAVELIGLALEAGGQPL